ncbi:hypothetical protein LCGC14_2848800 [marine sediment metagenome]|uniref:Sulfotransferase domain-containing protein n=1 Tax=marine sediment metagenome TaxID=412755 RepID=A0A0F8YVU3_9ZZZZ
MQVIVCGPNRSGTSLIMRCLEKAEFKMAEDLKPGDSANIYGYYESMRFKELCQPRNLINGRPDIEAFRELLAKEGKWAWKYPKVVFLLEAVFEAAENMFVIYMDRPRKDVVKSMIRHAKLSKARPYVEEAYEYLYIRALIAIDAYKHKKLKVSFLDLVKNEKRVMNEVLDFLGLEANYNYTAVDIGEVHFKEER